MTVVDTMDSMERELAALGEASDGLAAALSLAATQLSVAGLAPPAELPNEIESYRLYVRRVIDSCPDAATRSVPQHGRISRQDLERILRLRKDQDEAVNLLQQVLHLTADSESDRAALHACQADAEQLRRRLVSEPSSATSMELTALRSGRHPVTAVWRLASQLDTLVDDEWAALQEQVVAAYGRQLSTALSRGRIVVRKDSRESMAPPPVVETVEHTAATPTPDDDLIFDVSSDLAAIEASVASRKPSVSSALPAAGNRLEAHLKPPVEIPVPPPVPVSLLEESSVLPDDAASLARSAAACSGQSRIVRLTTLICQLIHDDRLDLAAILAVCLEARSPTPRDVIPSAVLRSLVLGRRLCYPRGELARQLDQELRQVKPLDPAETDQFTTGVGLLMRAASLVPALVGATPAAAILLRSFRIDPRSTHLYNYCARVIAAGEHAQGQPTEFFSTAAGAVDHQAELTQLNADVRAWLNGAVKRVVTYTRSSPLFLHGHWTVLASAAQRTPETIQSWAKWQEVLLTAHRLLRPVRDDLQSERTWVKQEITRLAQLRPAVGTAGDHPGKRGQARFSPDMQTLLLEAVEFANRWLRVTGSNSTRQLIATPPAAEELQTELLDRTPAVLAELQTLAERASSVWVQTGVEACRRAIEQIRRLCAGELALGLHETEPKMLLAAELLKIPDLEINDQWQLLASPKDVERAVLEHLASGVTTWQEAFELHCSLGDHTATARLLELPRELVGENLAAWESLRTQHLDASRRAMVQDLDDFLTQIARSAVERPELEPERKELERRIVRLRQAVPRLLRFAPVRSQLDQLRVTWQRTTESAHHWTPSIAKIVEPTASAVEPDEVDDAPATTPTSFSIFGEES